MICSILTPSRSGKENPCYTQIRLQKIRILEIRELHNGSLQCGLNLFPSAKVKEGGEQEQDWMWFAPFGDAFFLLLVVRRFHDLRSWNLRLLKVGPLRGPEVTCET